MHLFSPCHCNSCNSAAYLLTTLCKCSSFFVEVVHFLSKEICAHLAVTRRRHLWQKVCCRNCNSLSCRGLPYSPMRHSVSYDSVTTSKEGCVSSQWACVVSSVQIIQSGKANLYCCATTDLICSNEKYTYIYIKSKIMLTTKISTDTI